MAAQLMCLSTMSFGRLDLNSPITRPKSCSLSIYVQYKRVWWEAGKRYLKLRLSTKALKTIEKDGLDVVAKKSGFNLRKE